MSVLHFSDGVSIDTSGPIRIALLSDGFYVIGRGHLIPVENEKHAEEVIERIGKTRKPIGDYIDFEDC